MGVADLTERYRSNQRQNRLNDIALFPFIISSLKGGGRRGASHPIHPHWIRPCPTTFTDIKKRWSIVRTLIYW